MARPRKPPSPFRYFNSSPEVIRLVVMMYVKFPLSLRNVEDLLAERGIDICHETVRFWWNRFGPMFAAEIRLIAHANADPICTRLMTAPGVGPFVAVQYKAVIDIPERFSRSQTVGAHLGLTPRTVQTGDKEYRTRISKCGDMALRRALYLAGWGVMKTKGPNPLREWAEAIAARRGRNRAIIALARRLAVILHRMWMDGTDYRALPA
jgi:hypothetical protein